MRSAEKKVMGRPRQHEKREIQRNFRFTAREDEALRSRAEISGQSVMEFGRAAMLSGTSAARHLPKRTEFERRQDEQLRRLGVNLNQMMRWMNRHPEQSMPHDLPVLLGAIREHLKSVLTDVA